MFVVAAYGLCADSEKRSIRLLGEAKPAYRGRPEQCHEQLCELADRYGTTEVATYALSRDSRDRLHSYRLLARAFGLPAAVDGLDQRSPSAAATNLTAPASSSRDAIAGRRGRIGSGPGRSR